LDKEREKITTPFKCLDLFCGLGGWSIGFHKEGFEVLGVEINPEIAKLYPFECLVKDVREINGKDFRDFEVIVGSPPCRDFSVFADRFSKTWKKEPRNIVKGLELVNVFLRIIEEARPQFWLMENVPRLADYLKIKPKCMIYLGGKPFMRRVFFGEFPNVLFPYQKKLPMRNRAYQKGRKIHATREERAKIPLITSLTLARAIKRELERRENKIKNASL